LIANHKSGQGKGGTLAHEARIICDEMGYELIEYDMQDFADPTIQIQRAVQNAEADGGVLIAAGGDGTIRSVAQAAYGKKLRFAVVPCGTFNFFARAHQIPEDHLMAFRLALSGRTRPVRLGQINDHVFLINASIGLYAKAIRDRERRTNRYGRNRLVVILSTILTLFSNYLLLRVEFRVGEVARSVHTAMIFIGNNTLQLRDLALSVAGCMKHDYLAVVLLKPISKMEVFRILFRGLFKTLDNEESLESFCVDEMTVYTNKPVHLVALDGEMTLTHSPLIVRALPDALQLVCPPLEVAP
jgi:diacylglycerol kinase family enzyme